LKETLEIVPGHAMKEYWGEWLLSSTRS